MTDERPEFTDEMLTAYLDGELDSATAAQVAAALPALEERLGALDVPVGQIRQVMAPDVLGAPSIPTDLIPTAHETGRPRLWGGLAIAASFAVGVGLTSYLRPPAPAPAANVGWIAAVASYQALYVPETLSGAVQDSTMTQSVLARATDAFGVALDPALAVEGLDFKRAQMLGFKGKPLLQMAYLSSDGVPMALCLTRVNKPDRGMKPAQSHGLSGVSWVQDGVGYLLIGGANAERVSDLAQAFVRAI